MQGGRLVNPFQPTFDGSSTLPRQMYPDSISPVFGYLPGPRYERVNRLATWTSKRTQRPHCLIGQHNPMQCGTLNEPLIPRIDASEEGIECSLILKCNIPSLHLTSPRKMLTNGTLLDLGGDHGCHPTRPSTRNTIRPTQTAKSGDRRSHDRRRYVRRGK